MDRQLKRHFNANNSARFAERALTLARRGTRIPLSDELLFDFAVESVSGWAQSRGGFVYAATNPLFPHVVKIGQTGQRQPQTRVKALSTAGLPVEFTLVGSAWFPDRHWAEAELHRMFRSRHAGKEFFRVLPDRALRQICYLASQEAALYEALTGLTAPSGTSPRS